MEGTFQEYLQMVQEADDPYQFEDININFVSMTGGESDQDFQKRPGRFDQEFKDFISHKQNGQMRMMLDHKVGNLNIRYTIKDGKISVFQLSINEKRQTSGFPEPKTPEDVINIIEQTIQNTAETSSGGGEQEPGKETSSDS